MKKTILGLAVLAAALLAVSAAWSDATKGRWGRFEDYMCQEAAKPFFLSSPAEGGALVTQGRKGAQPFSFSMPKPAGIKRVFVIGESAAGLLARGGKDSFEEIFKAAAGEPVEIINCGMGAYDSSRIYGVFLEALSYSPDLVILLSGNNEIGPEIEACPGPSGFFRTVPRWLRALAFSAGRSWREGRRLETDRAHADRLEKMAALAGRRGVGFMMCTLPYNPAFPPYGPMPLEDADFAAAFALLERGETAGAQARLRDFVSKKPADTFGLYYLGLAAAKAGDPGQAGDFYERALASDSRADRAGAARNSYIRGAAARTGACLGDLEAALGGGLPSPLADGVHWHKRYDREAALEILRGLAACPAAQGLQLRVSPPPRAEQNPAARREVIREESLAMLNYAAGYLLFPAEGPPYLNSRALYQLEGACARDKEFIRAALESERSLEAALTDNMWVGEMRSGAKTLLPLLRRHAEGPCSLGLRLYAGGTDRS